MARCHKSGYIPSSQSADDSGSSNGGVADGDDILEFCFEDTVAPLSVHIFSQCMLATVAQHATALHRAGNSY